ncbi:MAG: hypothetical protein M1381_03735 [Deltaproteobacteria bacterium]|nr:hypothetical protein [Deltaproteobacteria bacterium]MCL5792504.1 hypothetical protein [Deltaproteobacteria bacterium]
MCTKNTLKKTKEGQRKYVEFVEAMIDQRYESPLKAAVASSILGVMILSIG